jgi:thymidine kinase
MKKIGFLEVIAGPMFCGKTEEMIRLVKRAVIGKKKVQVFKHSLDKRYGNDGKLHSHAGLSYDSELVTKTVEIENAIKKDTDIVAIDEAQWFGENLVSLVQKLLEKKYHVIVAGLAMTFDRQPFVPIPALMAMADKVTKLSAVCSICGTDAVFHKRVTAKGPKVDPLVADPGFVSKMDATVFQARCRRCFRKK